MTSLNDEYSDSHLIYKRRYEQQKKYRKTKEGKIALRRAKEKQLLKKMEKLGTPHCFKCQVGEFECLTIHNNKILCYNCRYRRPKVFEEFEICQ